LVVFRFLFIPFPGSDFLGLNRGQELKERSRHKSLFIRNESGVWAALSWQRALVEEANQRLSQQSTEAAELRVTYAAIREEAA
jgi:hypothetical protein